MKKVISIFTLICICLGLVWGGFFSRAAAADGGGTSAAITDGEALLEYLEAMRLGEEAEVPDVAAPTFDYNVRSAVLMEAETGTVLFNYSGDEKNYPASVTKVMTMLLIMEAIDSGKITEGDEVTASEHAVSMGGTQIYLEVGETMTVKELLLAVAVPSANDAAVALAEYVAGSEEEFVRRMNQRAAELGMTGTNFTNATGLFDDDNHYTTARDIALMTAELLKHKKIFDYTTVWMDSLRDGKFGLANTNKMLRTYAGMNGMKTGYTSKSLYCFSGTAERNGMTLIVTIMGGVTSEERFKASATLLDYGFASYAMVGSEEEDLPLLTVKKGKLPTAEVECENGFRIVVPKGYEKKLEVTVTLEEEITAPAQKGQQVGLLTYKLEGKTVKTFPIVLKEEVEKAGVIDYFKRFFGKLV